MAVAFTVRRCQGPKGEVFHLVEAEGRGWRIEGDAVPSVTGSGSRLRINGKLARTLPILYSGVPVPDEKVLATAAKAAEGEGEGEVQTGLLAGGAIAVLVALTTVVVAVLRA